MTIKEAIVDADIDYPVFEDFYDSNKTYLDEDGDALPKYTEWIAYNISSETPSQFADDWDEYTTIDYDVHFFTRSNSTANTMKVELRNALRDGGYIIEQTQKSYENDTGYYHVLVSVTINDYTEV